MCSERELISLPGLFKMRGMQKGRALAALFGQGKEEMIDDVLGKSNTMTMIYVI